MPKKTNKTLRLAFIRKRINNTFRNQALREALLAQLDGGEDAALVIQMVEKVRPVVDPPVQAVAPVPVPQNAGQPQPGPAQPQPGPAPPQPGPAPRQAPLPAADGNTRAGALEVLDSDDELVQDLRLTPRRERRLRDQLQVWRSSSSD